MIKKEDQKFLLDFFGFDVKNYSDELLNSVLDEIINILEHNINVKISNIRMLENEYNNMS